MANDLRETLRLWFSVMELVKVQPKSAVQCPFCKIGVIEVHDVASTKDVTVGERFFRCTRCNHSTSARIHFGPDGPVFARPEAGREGRDPAAAVDFADSTLAILRDRS